MKNQSPTTINSPTELFAKPAPAQSNFLASFFKAICGLIALAAVFLATPSAEAQTSAIRLLTPQVRFTVPVGSNGTLVSISNLVSLATGCTNANLDVSGLPPGGTAVVLKDLSGSVLGTITNTQYITINLNYTNLSQGLYFFNLNAGGFDTNGLAVTNTMPMIIQAAHIWNVALTSDQNQGISNSITATTNWLGGVPGAGDDAIFSTSGAQTNPTYINGTAVNIGVQADTTLASIRFSQVWFTNGAITNTSANHAIQISAGKTLTINGTNGFSLLRDTVDGQANVYQSIGALNVNISGAGGTLAVSNANANFSMLVGGNVSSLLNLTNLGTFTANVKRFAIGDYTAYPNYAAINRANNSGNATNKITGLPNSFVDLVVFARTNIITASYVDPNNYTNEIDRNYGISDLKSEVNGTSAKTAFTLGISNLFKADGMNIVGAGMQSGGGIFGFQVNGGGNSAWFRNTDGVSRMSVFSVADSSSSTNFITSATKLNTGNVGIDFSGNTNYVNLLADRLYICRDKTLINSNQTPNIQAFVTFGYGDYNFNTAVLGFQEHSNKISYPLASPYLGYCQANLTLKDGNIGRPCNFNVNGNLTLGYTADINSPSQAQQYNTYGKITISSNVTMSVSNIICDGGLNYYDANFPRQNNITINQGGNLIVTNAIGFYNLGASDIPVFPATDAFAARDPRGMLLDTLTLNNGGTLSVILNPSKTNVFLRTLTTTGTGGIIKVAGLPPGQTYPATFPVISYQNIPTATINADLTLLGAGYYGLFSIDYPKQLLELVITTNPPNQLIWTGAIDNNWDTTTKNWKISGSGVVTNFNQGDAVIFDDTALQTNVIVTTDLFPSQTGVGMLVTNNTKGYVFSGSGTIAGTAQVIKTGTNTLQMDSGELGAITVFKGNVSGSGSLGSTILASNVVLNFSGTINGGLTSTGMVFMAGGAINGPISIQAGGIDTSATINTGIGQTIFMAPGTAFTNEAAGKINVGVGAGNGSTWDVPAGSTLANFGLIELYQPKLTVEGLLFGAGTGNINAPGSGAIADPNGGGNDILGTMPFVRIQNGGVISPGMTPFNSISNMYLFIRFDVENNPANSGIGIGTARIEVDFSNAQTNDCIYCDRWNDINGYFSMTNINTGAGTFALGQAFQVLNYTGGNAGGNKIDTRGYYPTLLPYIPAPTLQWGVTNFTQYGLVTIIKTPLIWAGGGGASWDTNNTAGAWKSGQIYTDENGSYFDDSATGSTTVNLNSIVAPAGYPSVNYTNYTTNLDLTINTNITAYTNFAAITPGIVVSNSTKNYVFTGALTNRFNGLTGLYKTGSGTLTLLGTTNSFTGYVIVAGGTLAVTNAGAIPNIISLGSIGAGQQQNDLILDGGTLSYVGSTNVSLPNPVVVNSGNGTIGVTSATNWMAVAGFLNGSANLTKSGPGTLILNKAGSYNYSGVMTVSAGTLRLNAADAVGMGSITLANTSALEATNISLTLTNPLNITGSAVALNFQAFNTNIVTGPWTGAGSVTFSNLAGAPFIFNNDLSAFSGTISLGASSANYQFNSVTNKNPCIGSALATFDLGTGSTTLSNLNGGALTYNLGGLAGGANTILAGRATNNVATNATSIYSIGANGSTNTFSGKIVNGWDAASVVSVVKVGAGKLVLNGASTYTGYTTISNGVLGGTGSIASALTNVSGIISPGVNGIGTFTVSNGVTLLAGSTTLMELSQANPGQTNDLLVVTGTMTGGGSLIVTNVGPNITNGATFKLFNQGVTGFSSTVLPSGGGSYVWNNTISANGSITLVSGGVAVASTNAYLTSLTLSPAGTLSPSFASGVLSYTTTEAYGNTPTVTVVNTDLTATNQLIYNNTTNLLASGSASSALTLNVNPAITNVVKVKVTAQDGVTVQTYTVNIKQLPSQTAPLLSRNVSGGILTFNWPIENTGWTLQVQTNNLSVGLYTNWFVVPGSTSTNTASAVIDANNGSVFYRLTYP